MFKRMSSVARARLAQGCLWLGVTLLLLLLGSASFFVGRSSAPSPTPTTRTVLASHSCVSVASPWSPVGVQWELKISFLSGPRQGQVESSLMTFGKDGSLTATFPGATPTDPPILPPAIDGQWCLTAPNAFHYQFREVVSQAAMFVQPQVDAVMTSATTYQGAGTGAAYSIRTGQPLAGQSGQTETRATVLVGGSGTTKGVD